MKQESPDIFVINACRVLTILEKAIGRLIRQHYFNRNQIDENVKLVDDAIKNTRNWIIAYKSFYNVSSFTILVSRTVEELVTIVKKLIMNCASVSGKKQVSSQRKQKECNKLCSSIDAILEKLTSFFPKCFDSQIADDLILFVLKEFQDWCESNDQLLNKIKFRYSKRGNQTGIIPFADAKIYDEKILNKKWFKQNVLPTIDQFYQMMDIKQIVKKKIENID